MLAIRMQRTGRSGHASFRVVVQDSRQSPTSGKFVAMLGSYDPHTHATTLAKEKASFYLEHGAQPSERVARLLKKEGIKLPDWTVASTKKAGKIRNPDKLRRNRPADAESKAAPAETPAPEAEASEEPAAVSEEVTTSSTQEPASDETPAPEEAVSPADQSAEAAAVDEPTSESATETSEPEQEPEAKA